MKLTSSEKMGIILGIAFLLVIFGVMKIVLYYTPLVRSN